MRPLSLLVAALLLSAAVAATATSPPTNTPQYQTSRISADFSKSNSLLWRATLGEGLALSSPVATNDGSRVYVVDATGVLYALNPSLLSDYLHTFRLHHQGTFVHWTFKGDASGSATTVIPPALSADNAMVFYATSSALYCLNAETGQKLWAIQASVTSPILVIDDTVLFGTLTSAVYAHATNGTIYATFVQRGHGQPGPRAPVVGAPSSYQDQTFVTCRDTEVYSFSLDGINSGVNWGNTVQPGHPLTSAPVVDVANKQLLLTTTSTGGGGGGLFSILFSSMPFFNTPNMLLLVQSSIQGSALLVDDTTAVVGDSDGNIYAVNITAGATPNQPMWKSVLGQDLVGTGLTDGNVVIMPTSGENSGSLIAVNAKTGAKMWTFDTVDALRSTPYGLPDNTIVLGDASGNIYMVAPTNIDAGSILIVIVFILVGLFSVVFGLKYTRASSIIVGTVATFLAVITLVSSANMELANWKGCLIAAACALVIAGLVAAMPKAAAPVLAVTFVLAVTNGILIGIEMTYAELGWKVAVGVAAGVLLFGFAALKEGSKKFMTLLGVSSAGSTLLVDAVVSFFPKLTGFYVAIIYGIVFFVSLLLQARLNPDLAGSKEDTERPLLKEADGAVAHGAVDDNGV